MVRKAMLIGSDYKGEPMIEKGLVARIYPDDPRSPKLEYKLTKEEVAFIESMIMPME